jgi:hypothetical protein
MIFERESRFFFYFFFFKQGSQGQAALYSAPIDPRFWI